MENLRLNKMILEVVDNRLKEDNPSYTKYIYDKLLDAGYSESESKDKIGSVVLIEIHDFLKTGKSFDEGRYQQGLKEMFHQSIEFEDNYYRETEWEKWNKLIQKGYKCFDEKKSVEGLCFWEKGWLKMQSIINRQSKIIPLLGWMEELDYAYAIDAWLRDYEMELANAKKHEERNALCRKVVESFDWRDDDNSYFKCGIGESLFDMGKKDEAIYYYEKWLAEDSENYNGINSFSWILFKNGEVEKAYSLVRKITWGVTCNEDNSILFIRAKPLARYVGKYEESEWYQKQLDKFEKSIISFEIEKEEYFDEITIPKQRVIVKAQVLPSNPPCPCGSGKKYEKCCGGK